MNCTSCQAPLTPQSNYCNACGKPSQPAFLEPVDKEKKRYRRIIFIIAFFMIGETVFYWMLDLLGFILKGRIDTYTTLKPLHYLITICFYSIPLLSGFAFPKKSKSRIVLIIIGSIILAIKISLYIKQLFFEIPYDYMKF